jgi:hypothetical protein
MNIIKGTLREYHNYVHYFPLLTCVIYLTKGWGVSVCTISLNVGLQSIFWPKGLNFTAAFRGFTHFDAKDLNYTG